MNDLTSISKRATRALIASLALFAAALAVLATAGSASAVKPAKNFDIGFADFLYGTEGSSDREMTLTESVNADVIRVNMFWSLVAPNEPADPRNPDDPAYDWREFDIAIANAEAHGFDVDLTVTAAPFWAEGPNRPDDFDKFPPGSYRPDADAFGDFAHALAVRYSGSFTPGTGSGSTATAPSGGGGLLPLPFAQGGALPAVEYFEAWNEPNLSTYITPQWDGKKNVASDIYAKLLDSFYREVKLVNPNSKIVSGGTAPYGDPPGGPNRTQPLRFMQELLCLNTKGKKKSSCPNGTGEAPSFDIYAHHPINRLDDPEEKADNKGDIEVADFGKLTRTMRKAEKLGTLSTPGRHAMWANEVWWQTNPPDKDEGFPLKTHARFLSQALYLLWKQGASNVSFLQFRDAKYTKGEFTLASYQTGVYTFKGKRKPSADAVAFPFVTDRKGKKLLAWGRAPESGKVKILAKVKGKGGFKKVGQTRAKQGKVFTTKLRLKAEGKIKFRAKIGREKSVVWVQKD